MGRDLRADRRFFSGSDSHTALSTPQLSVWQGWNSYASLFLLGAQWKEKRPCLPFQKLSFTQNLLASPSWAGSLTTEVFLTGPGGVTGRGLESNQTLPPRKLQFRSFPSQLSQHTYREAKGPSGHKKPLSASEGGSLNPTFHIPCWAGNISVSWLSTRNLLVNSFPQELISAHTSLHGDICSSQCHRALLTPGGPGSAALCITGGWMFSRQVPKCLCGTSSHQTLPR